MLKKLSEKLGAKFPATTPGCSMLKFAQLDDAFSEVFLTASKPSRRSITAAKKKKKGEKGKAKKNSKNRKALRRRSLSQNFDLYACPSHNALKHDAVGKKGKLLCCKCIFIQIKGNLAEIRPKNQQNVQKTHFLQKVPVVSGLITCAIHSTKISGNFGLKLNGLVRSNRKSLEYSGHLSRWTSFFGWTSPIKMNRSI